jgi:1-aminocyclopropane-1-carboxylate deaminase
MLPNSLKINQITFSTLKPTGIQVFMLRDDLFYPSVSSGDTETCLPLNGNKWRKMKYNLEQMKAQNKSVLVSFGGAFSNHIFAVAAAGKTFGFKTLGIIRGEESPTPSSTLNFAKSCGMELRFVSRSDYRTQKQEILTALKHEIGDFYTLPEGGTNPWAVLGAMEIVEDAQRLLAERGLRATHFCVPCGTCGTMAGMVAAAAPDQMVLGFSALKGDFLKAELEKLLEETQQNQELKAFAQARGGTRLEKLSQKNKNYQIQTDFHFGGYAKQTAELLDYIEKFKETHHIQLDRIYNGKMMFGLEKCIEAGFFPENSVVVAIHTGGLQIF